MDAHSAAALGRSDGIDQSAKLLVAALTRGVRDTLHALRMQGERPEAAAQHLASLTYVMALTEQAANSTLDFVEGALPISERLVADLQVVKEADAGNLLAASCLARANEMQQRLIEVVAAQGFHDLTAQIIRRVVAALTDVELNLQRLASVATRLEQLVGIESVDVDDSALAENDAVSGVAEVAAEGPRVPGVNRTDVLRDQAQVDDLLSDLGL